MIQTAKPRIQLRIASKVFLTEELETHALSDVDIAIEPGEFVAVAGPSGCV
jgi:putative ABC transport system ATP-binding protein